MSSPRNRTQTQLSDAWKRHQAGEWDVAQHAYQQVLADQPSNADAWVYLGILQFDRRDFSQSTDSYRKAIEFRSHFPIAWNNLGNSLRMLGQIEEADDCFAKAIDQQPGYLSAFKNRGTLWVWSGEIQRGLRWYQAGLEIDPNESELHRNIGVIELLRGNYDVGWPEYRWRWRMAGMGRPPTPAVHWQGQSLIGKRFLLYPEQGLGDQLQFVRVARQLKDRGAEVVLRCPQRLLDLMSSTTETLGVSELSMEGTPVPTTDFHASMIEVVDVLYQGTGKIAHGTECFGDRGYLRVSDPLVAYWKRWLDQKLALDDNRFRIGINWQGNPKHHADVYRSIDLDVLEPLLNSSRYQIVSLQFGEGAEQLERSPRQDQVLRLPSDLDQGPTSGFTDTAAILEHLDAVVTTDTSIAHLAGSMGVPVHLLLGCVPDWRWLTSGTVTQWYPSMTLHRQSEFGRWEDVIDRVIKTINASCPR